MDVFIVVAFVVHFVDFGIESVGSFRLRMVSMAAA